MTVRRNMRTNRAPRPPLPSRRFRRRPGFPKPPARTAQLSNIVRAMASLGMARKAPSNARGPRRNRDIGAQERMNQKGHEFLGVVKVPTTAAIGQKLYQLEVNPQYIPRLSVIASQYKQWKGPITLHVESLGNAFATSSIAAAFVPDPDAVELTQTGVDLLRVVDSAPSKTSLHLQESVTKNVKASWSLTTNPWKFVQDTDPSDRSNGLFVIVALGSPGSVEIDLKISVSYDVTFQGNTYLAMEPTTVNALAAWQGVNDSLSDIEFAPGASGWVIAGPTITLNYPTGSVPSKFHGTWVPSPGLSQVYAAENLSPTAGRYISSLANFDVSATRTIYTYTTAVPAIPANPHTFISLPRSAGQT